MTHHYTNPSTGDVYPSVTKIISDTYPADYSAVRAYTRKMGWDDYHYANIGTLVHYRILSQISTSAIEFPDLEMDRYPPGIEKICDRAERMFFGLGLKIVNPVCEQFGYNDKHRYCGTFDLFGEINDVKTLIDIKTSETVKDPEYYLQLGAYSLLTPWPPLQAMIICLPRPGRTAKTAGVYKLEYAQLMEWQDKFIEITKEWWKNNA